MKLMRGLTAGIGLSLAFSSAALAAPSPNGPGQPGSPNITCQQFTTTPGGAANGQSPFNSNGQAGAVHAGNPGTASLNSNNLKAVSQYDVACFQRTTK